MLINGQDVAMIFSQDAHDFAVDNGLMWFSQEFIDTVFRISNVFVFFGNAAFDSDNLPPEIDFVSYITNHVESALKNIINDNEMLLNEAQRELQFTDTGDAKVFNQFESAYWHHDFDTDNRLHSLSRALNEWSIALMNIAVYHKLSDEYEQSCHDFADFVSKFDVFVLKHQ